LRRAGEIEVTRAGGFEIYHNNQVFLEEPIFTNAALEPWVWRPSEELRDELPKGWMLLLGCESRKSGDRIFYPLDGPSGSAGDDQRSSQPGANFIAQAFAGGLALLIKANFLTLQQRQSYRGMWLFYRRIRRTRDYLKREFAGYRDLILSSGCVDNSLIDDVNKFLNVRWRWAQKPTVVPVAYRVPKSSAADGADREEVRSGQLPTSENIRVEEVVQIGSDAAVASGIANPTKAEQVQHGLIEIARRATHIPLEETPEQLVRRALFAPDLDEQMLVDCLQHPLTEAILNALVNHENDDDELFWPWFWGGHNSFVAQIAKNAKYSQATVRELLAALGCRALDYVGECIQGQMSVLAQAIDPPLNPREQATFNHMYVNQAYLGNLPAILLCDRWQFLQPVLTRIWEQPDDLSEIVTLHRALKLYAELVRERRSADTVRKRQPRRRTKRLPYEVTGDEDGLGGIDEDSE
jgi:hypothetical protein